MSHEEARRLAEEARAQSDYMRGRLLSETALTGEQLGAVLEACDRRDALSGALLEALERIEELETGLGLTRMSVELIMARRGFNLEMDRDAKLYALWEIDRALSPGEAEDPDEEAK